MSWGSPHV
jgi:hypothetical protein